MQLRKSRPTEEFELSDHFERQFRTIKLLHEGEYQRILADLRTAPEPAKNTLSLPSDVPIVEVSTCSQAVDAVKDLLSQRYVSSLAAFWDLCCHILSRNFDLAFTFVYSRIGLDSEHVQSYFTSQVRAPLLQIAHRSCV